MLPCERFLLKWGIGRLGNIKLPHHFISDSAVPLILHRSTKSISEVFKRGLLAGSKANKIRA
jgi:hypothetical protein